MSDPAPATHSLPFPSFVRRYKVILQPHELLAPSPPPSPLDWTLRILQVVSSRREAQSPAKRRRHRRRASDGRQGDGWRLDEEELILQVSLLEWLDQSRLYALQHSEVACATLIQRVVRGFLVRRHFDRLRRAYAQLRRAFTRVLRAQFVDDDESSSDDGGGGGGDENSKDARAGGDGGDDEEVGERAADQLAEVTAHLRTIRLVAQAERRGTHKWAAHRVVATAKAQRAVVRSVIEVKNTLFQVLGFGGCKSVKVRPSREPAAYSVRDLLPLLSYALQEARRLDNGELVVVHESGMYVSDPLHDRKTGRHLSMKSTPEYRMANRLYLALQRVQDSLPAAMRRLYRVLRSESEVRFLVKQVRDVRAHVTVNEVEHARAKLKTIDSLQRQMEKAAKDQDLVALKTLLDKAERARLQRTFVEKARIKAVEMLVKRRLRAAMEASSIPDLAKTVQWAMDIADKEASVRKKRRQRNIRSHWIQKKKSVAGAATSFADDEHALTLDIDEELQRAQAMLHEWMQSQRAAKERTGVLDVPAKVNVPIDQSPRLMSQIAKQEEQALNLKLGEAAVALEHMRDEEAAEAEAEASEDEDEDEDEVVPQMAPHASARRKHTPRGHGRGHDESPQVQQMRHRVAKVCSSVSTLLSTIHSESDARMRAADLLTRPKSHEELAHSLVPTVQLRATRGLIEKTLIQCQEAGFGATPMESSSLDTEGGSEMSMSEDMQRVNELEHAFSEVDTHLQERVDAVDQIKEVLEMAREAYEARGEDGYLEQSARRKLFSRVKLVLQNGRLVTVDESDLEALQDLYDAMTTNDRDRQLMDLLRKQHDEEDAAESVEPPQPQRFGGSLHIPDGLQVSARSAFKPVGVGPSPSIGSSAAPPSSSLNLMPGPAAGALSSALQTRVAKVHEERERERTGGSAALVAPPEIPEAELEEVKRLVSRTLRRAKGVLRAVTMNLNAVALFEDLSSRPGEDTPMVRGRVRTSDLTAVAAKIEQTLAATGRLGLDDGNFQPLRDLAVVADQLRAHMEERSRTLQRLDELLEEVTAQLPIGYMGDETPASLQDDELVAMGDRLSVALANARRVGLVEEQLVQAQEVFEDIEVFEQGRRDARVEARRVAAKIAEARRTRPGLDAANALSDELLEFGVLGEVGKEDLADLRDAALEDLVEMAAASVGDCEIVAIPADEPPLPELREAVRELHQYMNVCAYAKAFLLLESRKTMEESSRTEVRGVLDFASRTGVLDHGSGDESWIKAAKVLQRRLTALHRRRSVSLVRGSEAVRSQQIAEIEALDRKLTEMVPEARKRLSQAIEEGDEEALATAIKDAKTLEMRVQKLRKMRRKLLGDSAAGSPVGSPRRVETLPFVQRRRASRPRSPRSTQWSPEFEEPTTETSTRRSSIRSSRASSPGHRVGFAEEVEVSRTGSPGSGSPGSGSASPGRPSRRRRRSRIPVPRSAKQG